MTYDAPIIIEPPAEAKKTIICLHGLGAEGSDLLPITTMLSFATPTRFIFPHAPYRAITLNGGMVMRAWYDILGLNAASREDETGLEESRQMITSLIEAERDKGLDAQDIALAGFSQGGALALYAALQYPQTLAGVVALSTYVPLREQLAAKVRTQDVPIWMAHGTLDPIVPFDFGKISYEWLKSKGFPVEWSIYAMGHEICPEELQAMRNWLHMRF